MITDVIRPLGLRLILRLYHLADFKHLITRACVLQNDCTIDLCSSHSRLPAMALLEIWSTSGQPSFVSSGIAQK
jgi:hypothetical protein